jgi:uncharacterized protein YndB with AHSA1/START domain
MTEIETSLAPVRKRVRVACDVEHAFRTFTEAIDTWWPLRTHSMSAGPEGEHPPEKVVFEQQPGGRVYEIAHDGRECTWGTLLAYDAPHRVVLEWTVNPAAPPTEVEVVFSPDGDGTIVELEHRGWERYAEGGTGARESYDSGWPGVLRLYEGAASDGSISR